VGGTPRFAARLVQLSNRNICLPVQTNPFERLSELLKLRTTHPAASNERDSRDAINFKVTWPDRFRVWKPAPSRVEAPQPGKIVFLPTIRRLGSATALEHGREDGLMCVRLSANFLLLAQGRSCASGVYPPQRFLQWLRNAE
jgi:hypothetical protein